MGSVRGETVRHRCAVCRKEMRRSEAAATLLSGGLLCSQDCVRVHAARKWPGGDPA